MSSIMSSQDTTEAKAQLAHQREQYVTRRPENYFQDLFSKYSGSYATHDLKNSLESIFNTVMGRDVYTDFLVMYARYLGLTKVLNIPDKQMDPVDVTREWILDAVGYDPKKHFLLDEKHYLAGTYTDEDIFYVEVIDQCNANLFIKNCKDQLNQNNQISTVFPDVEAKTYEEVIDILMQTNPLYMLEWFAIYMAAAFDKGCPSTEWNYNLNYEQMIEADMYLQDILMLLLQEEQERCYKIQFSQGDELAKTTEDLEETSNMDISPIKYIDAFTMEIPYSLE
jgi:hypothetical protein